MRLVDVVRDDVAGVYVAVAPVAPVTTPAPEMTISKTVDTLVCTGTSWPGSMRNSTTRASDESWMSAVAGRTTLAVTAVAASLGAS
jgi:hypothetical protein